MDAKQYKDSIELTLKGNKTTLIGIQLPNNSQCSDYYFYIQLEFYLPCQHNYICDICKYAKRTND